MNTFHWKNIKNGFRGFEELAFDYVKKEYPTINNWEHSQLTRDGNRDGYAIVFGFHPYDLHQEEWWMEAKYSATLDKLTRFRLDSTIVSAAICGNVSKIIFVTNISISPKTIVDIRIALEQSIQCGEVHFCTKNVLEYWLAKNPDVFQKYFPGTDIQTLEAANLFLSEEIEFYSEDKRGLSVSEPLQHIQLGKIYYIYFSIYSACECTLPLVVNTDTYRGIEILSEKQLHLSAGITPCVVKLRLKKGYSMIYQPPGGIKSDEIEFLCGAILKAGSLELITKQRISVQENYENVLSLPSQEEKIEILKKHYIALEHRKFSVCFITGISGTGKTYLMEKFVREVIDLRRSVFRITFTENQISNDVHIYQFLIYCLYPYLPPEGIDSGYLDGLRDENLKSSLIYYAASMLHEPDRLHDCFTKGDEREVFPNSLHLNPRVILLDDLQKLNEDSLRFLFRAIRELVKKEQPIFVLANR